jgi:DNA-binding HxlR family transcriptional regulator
VLRGAGNDELPTAEGLHPHVRSGWTPLARTLAATGDRWTLLIAVAQLHRCLPGVSTGVLERHVRQMVALGLVRRSRFKEMPPRVELELTDAGRELLPIAHALARWGMRHLWSPPRERECVDVDALLRLLPALLEEETGLPEGSVEAVVADADPPVRRIYRIDCGCLRMVDRAADGHMTCLHGDGDAWVAALGPACDYERLRITGDEWLARCILDALPRSA